MHTIPNLDPLSRPQPVHARPAPFPAANLHPPQRQPHLQRNPLLAMLMGLLAQPQRHVLPSLRAPRHPAVPRHALARARHQHGLAGLRARARAGVRKAPARSAAAATGGGNGVSAGLQRRRGGDERGGSGAAVPVPVPVPAPRPRPALAAQQHPAATPRPARPARIRARGSRRGWRG